MDRSTPGFPVLHYPLEFSQTHVHRVSGAIQPSRPLSPPSPPASIFPSIRVFSNESVLLIMWPKYWSFSFIISPSSEYSGLISIILTYLAPFISPLVWFMDRLCPTTFQIGYKGLLTSGRCHIYIEMPHYHLSHLGSCWSPRFPLSLIKRSVLCPAALLLVSAPGKFSLLLLLPQAVAAFPSFTQQVSIAPRTIPGTGDTAANKTGPLLSRSWRSMGSVREGRRGR